MGPSMVHDYDPAGSKTDGAPEDSKKISKANGSVGRPVYHIGRSLRMDMGHLEGILGATGGAGILWRI